MSDNEKSPGAATTAIWSSPFKAASESANESSGDLDIGLGHDALDENAVNTNPFSDPTVAEYWRATYEQSSYECRHVFDPLATWTPEEERRLIRKLDWHVCLWACVMFFGLQVDRGNLSQALSDNFLKDLHLTTNDYNYGNTVFLLSFLVAELPSQLLSKKIGPDRWIPTQVVLWSVVATSQCAITGRASFLATRCLLGLLEGGFIPDIVLWLSYFYTGRELPVRLSYFWTSMSVTTIVTSLLAFALLHLRGVHGWAGWRYLFLVEGLITLSIGLASFFLMPASAVQTKTWFRPRGWFTDGEITIVVNRVLRDDPSKGDMHNRQAVTPRRLWEAMKDYDMWPLYAIGLVAYIPQTPPSTYQSLILKALGFSSFNINLLAIPANVFHIINLIIITRLADYFKERTFVSMIQCIWTLPCVIAFRWWPGTMTNAWGTYALVVVLQSYPYCHAILVGWTSKNANNVGARSVSSALYNMSVQVGNIAASYIYRTDDAPLYHRGNVDLVAINILAIGVFIVTKMYYVFRNKQREKQWNALTTEEQVAYVRDTKIQGSRRLDFRFSH
ncbi:allantoate permease [Grosmannia clavigera kw1407]|uniref:Allantoate permease n=1 Tax=Grosmannia clavigera (strain kw1407 / UAMH 11150) TaxID=655863 RepID=F0XED8_GROCL|nr:allantoate permease [Grosmannia clavigera kw1407]EFX04083.1 allantoate permease [Grosmannia clavigera kw1407]